jgi:phytoene dehydrogenase-like protein
MDEIYDVVVVGGGMGGLAAAAVAAGAGSRVVVLEAHQPGGRASTTERRGYRLNQGAHALYRGGPAEAVLRDLGVHYRGQPPAASLFGRRGDDVELLPTSASTLARSGLLGVRAKVHLAAVLRRLPKIDAAAHAHETATAWLESLELTDDAAGIVRALTRVSTYSNALGYMSADAAISQLQQAAGSGVLYLDRGWQGLVDGLRAVAVDRGAEVRTHAVVLRVEATPSGHEVILDDTVVRGRAVVVASGGPEVAARLLGLEGVWQDRLGPASEVACLDLGLSKPARRGVLFGIDQPLYFSTHCPPADLAPPGRTLVSLLRYIAPGVASTADNDRAVLAAHAAAAGVEGDTIEMERFLHRMPAVTAVPIPAAGGLGGRPGVAVAEVPGAFVTGDWVGSRRMLTDAVLGSAAAAGRAAADYATAGTSRLMPT